MAFLSEKTSISATTTAITALPVGTVVAFASSAIPDGWLPCDGRQIVQSQYPNLFALIGGTVPDLRSRFIICSGQGPGLSNYSLNQRGGEESHVLTQGEMPAHNHTMGIGGGSRGTSPGPGNSEGYASQNTVFTGYTSTMGSSQGHNNIPPYHALIYIIKY